MSNFKISVLGPIPRDHITTHHGEVIEKYGCAMHPAIGLSRLVGEDGTVSVVSHVKKQDEGPVKAILEKYANIDSSQITSENDQGDIIQLKFIDQNNRLEQQTGFMNPILPVDVTPVLDSDVFVIVPITDYEVPLATLQYLKANSQGVIIFDAHGPTNGVSVDGKRFLQYWLDRDLWLPAIDVLKMNLEESHCCWFEEQGAEGTDHLPDFARHVLDHGVSALIVTLDEKGSAVYFKEGNEVREMIVPAIWVDHVVDTTGCGDSFAGGLGFGLLQDSTDYITAVMYANALGAQRTQGRTFEVFKSRPETEAMLEKHYPDLLKVNPTS